VRSISRPARPGSAAPTRMVWLPGAYHAAQDFLSAGFPQAVSVRQIPLDLTFVDLELQYLGDRTALERLRSEVVLPAQEIGTSVWLAGVSLGGLIALDYLVTYPDDLDGLCLLAPYLGNRMLTAEIAAAHGLAAWDPGELAQADGERRIWRYIKAHGRDCRPLHLGFGKDDRFGAAHALLAAALPADRVSVVQGGHDWRTWTTLWENFLDSRFK
jgi:pimeloyl-ACP methyl ester carboxylesterase